MASSYSTDLKLELMVTGENAGTWGDKTNTNLNLLQQAISGFESVTITDSATTTLTMSDAALSNARNMVIKIATVTLSGATTLALPDGIEKFYILDATGVTNPTNLTFKTTSGTGFTLDASKIYAAYSDGTNINEVSLDTLGGTIGSAQIADAAVSTAKLSNNAVTTAKISNANVTTAKIADNAITTDKISALQVTQAKIADDAVGPDQLSNTAVTAGSYTLADITVDAQGRITAASDGSAGGGNMVITHHTEDSLKWPSTGNFVSQPNTTKLHIYMAGGGGGLRRGGNAKTGRNGGAGLFVTTITSQLTVPGYTRGTAGTVGLNAPGNAGNDTTFHNFTAGGGGAESPGKGNITGETYEFSENNTTNSPNGYTVQDLGRYLGYVRRPGNTVTPNSQNLSGFGSGSGYAPPGPGGPFQQPSNGVIIIYEDIG